jgi:hypothetical protein
MKRGAQEAIEKVKKQSRTIREARGDGEENEKGRNTTGSDVDLC